MSRHRGRWTCGEMDKYAEWMVRDKQDAEAKLAEVRELFVTRTAQNLTDGQFMDALFQIIEEDRWHPSSSKPARSW